MILNSFRNASHSFVIKILFAAIIFSFCLWGVGDIIRNYSASKTVFSVEKMKVSVDQFLREYSQEKQRIRNIGSKPLSDKEMEKLNIKNLVLDKLVNDLVLEQMCEKLGILVSKETLVNVIHSFPDFRSKDGKFDERVYESVIRRSGMSEQGFLNQIKDNVARNQLIHPIIAGYKLPTFIEDIITRDFENQNTLVISKVKLDSIKAKKEASESEAKQYYENNKSKYLEAETRDASVMVIDYKVLGNAETISEEEVNKYYNENKELYKPEELRDFEMYTFESKEDADKAWDMLNRNVKSTEVIKKLTPDMENVRNVSRKNLPYEIAKDLFDLKLNKASKVYNLSGKYYIYRLTKLSHEKEKSEKEIKTQIKEELIAERMNSPEFYAKVKELKNKIDDGFGAGKSMEEVAKATGMKMVNLEKLEKNYDNSGLNAVIADEDSRTDVMNEIFSTDENQVTQIIDSKETDTVSYVVFVKKVRAESIPAFETIKDKVKHDYILEEKQKDILKQIGDITETKNPVATLKDKFETKSFKLSKKDLLLNQKVGNPVVDNLLSELPNPNVILNIISSLKEKEVTYLKLSDSEYVIIGMDKISRAQKTSPEFSQIISSYLKNALSSDTVKISLSAFKNNLKVDIDQKLLNEIVKKEDERNND